MSNQQQYHCDLEDMTKNQLIGQIMRLRSEVFRLKSKLKGVTKDDF